MFSWAKHFTLRVPLSTQIRELILGREPYNGVLSIPYSRGVEILL